jgi:hypothetical protein
MPELSDIMISATTLGKDVLKEIFRDPAITAYNRLEPRPRSEDFSRSLKAEVRDALWFITRQWQLGEIEAEDAGSPIDARLMTRRAPIDRFAVLDDTSRAYDDTIPLEVVVEREMIPWSLSLKVEIGQRFLRLHGLALRTKYAHAYRNHYPIDSGLEAEFARQPDSLGLYAATLKRAIDGEKLIAAINDHTFRATIGITDDNEWSAIKTVTDQLLDSLARLYSEPNKASPKAWEPGKMAYRIAIASPISGTEQAVLDAPHYSEGRLDWYAFDASPATTQMPDPAEVMPASVTTNVISFLPTAADFPGMPSPRFWEMEDRQVNFGTINAKTTDHLLLTFAEMGLVFGNDWFVIPFELPVNSLCEIRGLVVTDVFGDRTLIRAANDAPDSQWQRWSMFNVSGQDGDAWQGRYFFLPASITQTHESDSIEEVSFVRDEMANLAWAVEETIPDATGKGMEARLVAQTAGLPPLPAPSIASIRYVLGTTVPENWIPFLPVHLPGSVQDIRFQRAAMPKLGSPPVDVVRPRGVLLKEVDSPFYIAEAEILAAGTIVSRRFQRTRWYEGRTYLWLGRARETGRGGGSSGLRFDQIYPVSETPNA